MFSWIYFEKSGKRTEKRGRVFVNLDGIPLLITLQRRDI